MADFREALSKKSKNIDHLLKSYLPDPPKQALEEAMAYALFSPGKRLRPLLLWEAYRLAAPGGGDIPAIARPFMAALEMIHSFSLVHDDLPALDNDDLRRGRATTHKVYGEALGILAGDALLSLAYECISSAMVAPDNPVEYLPRQARALAILSAKSGGGGMIGGEALDVLWEKGRISQADDPKALLQQIHEKKTAALLEAPLMMGWCLGGGDAVGLAAMERAGRALGMAFQIQDDILDIVGSQEELGKPIGSDQRNQKATYVSLYGLEAAREAVEDFSRQALEALGVTGEDFLGQWILELAGRQK